MKVYTIIKNCTDPSKLYDDVRQALSEMDRAGKYPEDWTIKKIQRLCDAKYAELTGGKN